MSHKKLSHRTLPFLTALLFLAGCSLGAQDVREAEPLTVDEIAEKVSPSVVRIVATKQLSAERNFDSDGFAFNDPYFNSPFIEPDFDKEKIIQETESGSGFIVSKSGLVLTNKHVVEDKGASYSVITNDGAEYPAKVIDRHSSIDLATIQIESEKVFPVVTLGSSSNIAIDQPVVAVKSDSSAKGVIKTKWRTITIDTILLNNLLETSIPVDSGDSGSPLVDLKGDVIGVITALANDTQKTGFAIPIDEAKSMLDEEK